MTSRNRLLLFFVLIAAAASFGQIGAPKFSSAPGIYQNAFQLSITHDDPAAVIRYTTNGAAPSASSPILNGTIEITDRTNSPNVFSMIQTTLHPFSAGGGGFGPGSTPSRPLGWREPHENIAKGTAIRAAAFKDGSASLEISGSFFVFPPNSPYRTLPLVSIMVDSLDFFGHQDGIYVPGANAVQNDEGTGNFYMRSDEWEREGSFEYFDKNGNPVISQTVGYRINGSWTRRFPQKALRVYARGRYGDGTIDFKERLFHYEPYTDFKRIILRSGGNDLQRTIIRDKSAQYMISHVKSLNTQSFRSVVVFLNGEFWGLHNIRERYDKYYLQRVFGVDPENIDLLDFWSGGTGANARIEVPASEGDSIAYGQMAAFARNNNLANKANLDSIMNLMDIDSYLDHYAIQMFYGNTDGIWHNHKMWRERVPFKKNAPVGKDGRFRWLICDLDQIFDIWGNSSRPNFSSGPTFAQLFAATNPGNELFNNLMENDFVRQSFINSFANLLNSAFLPERTLSVIDSIAGTIRPVMGAQVRRWNNPRLDMNSVDVDSTDWNNEIARLKQHYQNRPDAFRTTVRNHFSAGTDRTVTLRSDTTHGFIKINTMTVDSKLPRVNPQLYPWSGTYFANVPLTVSGAGKSGYRIEKWIVNGTEFQDSVLTVSLSNDQPYSIEAVFVYDEAYIGVADQKVSHSGPRLSINHRIHSRSNVAFNFTLPEAGNVQLRVYNLAGKEVARVASGKFGQGSHQLNWNTGKTGSGVYIYRLKINNRIVDGRLRL